MRKPAAPTAGPRATTTIAGRVAYVVSRGVEHGTQAPRSSSSCAAHDEGVSFTRKRRAARPRTRSATRGPAAGASGGRAEAARGRGSSWPRPRVRVHVGSVASVVAANAHRAAAAPARPGAWLVSPEVPVRPCVVELALAGLDGPERWASVANDAPRPRLAPVLPLRVPDDEHVVAGASGEEQQRQRSEPAPRRAPQAPLPLQGPQKHRTRLPGLARSRPASTAPGTPLVPRAAAAASHRAQSRPVSIVEESPPFP